MLKKKVTVKIYDCYCNGELYMTGTRRAIMNELDMPEGISFANYERRPYRGLYTFKKTGNTTTEHVGDIIAAKNTADINKKSNERSYDEVLGYLFKHLFKDGITCLNGKYNPEDYLEDLHDMGLDVVYREVADREGGRRVGKHYILSVVQHPYK